MPFVKLDCGIIDSSVWYESSDTKVCWITMLAMADATGLVRSTAPGISRRAGISLDAARHALKIFESPDSDSRSDDSGQRIKRVDGGYMILNYLKYRDHDYTIAERQRRFRERKRNAVTTVTVTQAEAEADIKKKKYIKEKEDPVLLNLLEQSVSLEEHKKRMLAYSKSKPQDLEEVRTYCASINLPVQDAEYFYHKWCGNGFTLNGRPIKQWKSVIQSAKAAGYLPSQKNQPKKRLSYDL